jgi:hypothetical protein
VLQLNNPKGAFTAAGSRLSIREKAAPMGQPSVVRICRRPRVPTDEYYAEGLRSSASSRNRPRACMTFNAIRAAG